MRKPSCTGILGDIRGKGICGVWVVDILGVQYMYKGEGSLLEGITPLSYSI